MKDPIINNFNIWTCLSCMTEKNNTNNCIKCNKDKKLSIPPKLIRQTNEDNYKLDKLIIIEDNRTNSQ